MGWYGLCRLPFSGPMAQRGHKVTVITRKHKQMPPTQTGVEVIPVRWAPVPMSFTTSFGKHAIKAINQLKRRRSIDVVSVHLPLVSWNRKQFRYIEDNIAPVVSTLHGSWIGEREGVRRAALNREAATWRNPNDLAIRLTAKWYARYERAGVLGQHAALQYRAQPKKNSTNSTRFQKIRILKSSTMDVTTGSSDHKQGS